MNTESTIIESQKIIKSRGRPLAFDQDQALEAAMRLFWTHGYEGTSMAELSDVLDMNKPSIYAAFGNKEALFRKALSRYIAGPAAFAVDAMQAPTARQVVEIFLQQAIEFFSDSCKPNGCMMVQAALSCGKSAGIIQQELITYRQHFENALTKRFELGKLQCDLPQTSNTAALAKYITTIHQGLSVQATSGATKEELTAVVEIALRNWPEG